MNCEQIPMKQGKFQVLARFLYPYRWQIAGLIALTAVISILAMLLPLLIRAVIDRVITAGDRSLLFTLGAFMFAVPLINAVCGFIQVLGITLMGQKFVMAIRCAVYKHLMCMSIRFYGKHSVGKLVNRLMGDGEILQQMLSVGSIQVVSDFVCSVIAISITFTLNWRLASLLLLIVLLFVINYKSKISKIRRATRSYRGAEDRVAGGIQNRLVADLTVKTYGTESREHNIFCHQSDTSLGLAEESQNAANIFNKNTMFLRDMGHIVIYFLGCAMVLRGDASYGDVVAFTAYAMQLLWPAVRFSLLAQQIQDARISIDRLFELLEEKPEIISRPNTVAISHVQGKIDFNHVFFHYEKGRPVLRDIDFHVEPGKTVALVGPTGCGKTTILSLVMRFLDVVNGTICIDEIDIRDMDIASLRNQFGIVLQESLLFNVSIAENIRYSRQDASMEQIQAAAKIAEIHNDILSLPHGYDSEVQGRDINLSVGQKQRISIARAVLSNPAIIIMDEATSALDSESERAIQIAMNRFLVNRTSFIVAHRLSTIRNADRIIMIDNGRILEIGNHDELMAITNGKYQDLYNKHVGKGIISDE